MTNVGDVGDEDVLVFFWCTALSGQPDFREKSIADLCN